MSDERETADFDLVVREAEGDEPEQVMTLTAQRPSQGQLYIILGMLTVIDDDDRTAQYEAVGNFGTVVNSLLIVPEQRRKLNRLLAKGALELESFFGLAMDFIKYWAPEHHPDTPNNREERRQVARRAPAKRAAAPKAPAARRGR